jgi:Arc/MetJ-type ribon-helix-helix transcriptional regulator
MVGGLAVATGEIAMLKHRLGHNSFTMVDGGSVLWQISTMMDKLKTVHITLTPQIAELLEAEVASGRFSNLSEAIRNAAWKAFAEDPAAELREAFSRLDELPDQPAPDSNGIAAEIQAWRHGR